MITATFKLDWHGEPYKRKLLRELQIATRQGAERVRRNAVQTQLNTSGKSATSKAGLNRGSAGDRIARASRLTNLKTIRLKSGQTLRFGGTFQTKRKKKTASISRVYWYGEPLHRWVQSSFPGTPPHKQTGTLQRSIAVETATHGLSAKVGPGQKLKYARMQELGGRTKFGTLPPRPYMAPAFNAELNRIVFGYQLAIAKASR